jgi:TolA-binding protein
LPRITQPFRLRAANLTRLLIPFLFSAVFAGCVVGDFIGVYFNTYYNVQRLYSEAEDEVWLLPETKYSGRNLLATFTLPAPTKTKFTSVIEKCSKLLQYHPDSRYVDDALFIIAKSYYFQGDYQKTERKCHELIEGFPGSDYVTQAKLLLACTLYEMKDPAGAQKAALELVAYGTDQDDNALVARASLVLGSVERDARNLAAARDYFLRAGDIGDNADLRTMALLTAADVQALAGEFKGAYKTYRKAINVSTNYATEYRAWIGSARMLSRQGEYDDCLDELRALRENANYKEFYGEIELEVANALRDKGELNDAVQQYRMVDTTYPRTEWSANSYYQLGLVYETRLFLYDSARTTFQRGRTEWPQSTVTPQLIRHGDYLTRYFQFKNDVVRYDSIRAVIIARLDTSAQQTQSSDSLKRTSVPPSPPIMPLDTVNARLANAQNELATLFYVTIGVPDSALYWYNRVLREYPQSPLIPRSLYTVAQIYSQDSTLPRTVSDSLYREVVDRYPSSMFAAEARKKLGLPPVQQTADPAETAYHTAELLMLEGRALEAVDTLVSLVGRFPTSPIVPRAQYATGWLYENVIMNPDSAFAVYDRLVRQFPSSSYALKVQPKVLDSDVRKRFTEPPVVKDTTAVPPIASPDSLRQTPSGGELSPDQQPPPKPEPPRGGQPEAPPKTPADAKENKPGGHA